MQIHCIEVGGINLIHLALRRLKAEVAAHEGSVTWAGHCPKRLYLLVPARDGIAKRGSGLGDVHCQVQCATDDRQSIKNVRLQRFGRRVGDGQIPEIASDHVLLVSFQLARLALAFKLDQIPFVLVERFLERAQMLTGVSEFLCSRRIVEFVFA
jgi:hypothetical protein